MNRVDIMKQDLSKRVSKDDILKKIYFSLPTYAFESAYDIQYEIINDISKNFNIPYYNIHVTGSAKLGVSIHKRRGFDKSISDLDIAIIDKDLFVKYSEMIYKETLGFSNQANFPRIKDNVNAVGLYKEYLSKGIFMTKYIPSGTAKREWDSFFYSLSMKFSKEFKSINGIIYLSQYYFINKQRSIFKSLDGFEVTK
jgi:hypothetical protein